MNRVNWVDGRYTTPADFNAMQTDPEDHQRSQAKAMLAGFVDGLAVTGTIDGIRVAPGVAWDDLGRRIMVPSAVAVDVSAVLRPASGHYKWLVVYATYQRVERDTVRDSSGIEQPAYLDDGYTLTAATGPEFSAADLVSAKYTKTGKPAAPANSVALALCVVDHDSGWPALISSPPRPNALQTRVRFIETATINETRAAVSSLVPIIDDVAYGWGMCNYTLGNNDPVIGAPVLLVRRISAMMIHIVVGSTQSSLALAGVNINANDQRLSRLNLSAVFLG